MLKGRINKDGNLLVERAGKPQDQACVNMAHRTCGDWCPLFDQNGEPPAVSQAGEYYVLKLCQAELSLAEFKDEREWNEPKPKV